MFAPQACYITWYYQKESSEYKNDNKKKKRWSDKSKTFITINVNYTYESINYSLHLFMSFIEKLIY